MGRRVNEKGALILPKEVFPAKGTAGTNVQGQKQLDRFRKQKPVLWLNVGSGAPAATEGREEGRGLWAATFSLISSETGSSGVIWAGARFGQQRDTVFYVSVNRILVTV